MSLTAGVRRALRSPQREPSPPEPRVVPMADCDRLPPIRGRQAVRYQGETYLLDRHAIADSSPTERLTDGKLYVADTLVESGELIYWGTSRPRPSTPSKVQPRKPRPPRRIDAVAALPLFAARAEQWHVLPTRPERGVEPLSFGAREALTDPALRSSAIAARMIDEGPPPIVGHTAGEPPARGVASLLDRLRRAGVTASLSPKGSVVFQSSRGACAPALRPQLKAVAPLLRAHLAGQPLTCDFCGEQAVTLLEGGDAAACARHADEEL